MWLLYFPSAGAPQTFAAIVTDMLPDGERGLKGSPLGV